MSMFTIGAESYNKKYNTLIESLDDNANKFSCYEKYADAEANFHNLWTNLVHEPSMRTSEIVKGNNLKFTYQVGVGIQIKKASKVIGMWKVQYFDIDKEYIEAYMG